MFLSDFGIHPISGNEKNSRIPYHDDSSFRTIETFFGEISFVFYYAFIVCAQEQTSLFIFGEKIVGDTLIVDSGRNEFEYTIETNKYLHNIVQYCRNYIFGKATLLRKFIQKTSKHRRKPGDIWNEGWGGGI